MDERLSGRDWPTRRRGRARTRDVARARAPAGETARPRRLVEAMRYAALGGGKRLRPFLVIETARALSGRGGAGARRSGDRMRARLFPDPRRSAGDGRRRPQAGPADDPPRLRRGDRDPRWRRVADARFPDSGRSSTDPDAEIRAPLCAGLARAAGLAGMVGGQMLDIEAETATEPLSLEAIARLQAMKTGALLSFSVEAGPWSRARARRRRRR